MDNSKALEFTNRIWDESIVPTLCDYVRIPNKSPNFDPDWDSHGYMDQAAELMAEWCRKQPIRGMHIEVVRLEGRTPLLFIEIDGANDDTALLYGHLDKQPECDGWSNGLTPWEPVIRDGKLHVQAGAGIVADSDPEKEWEETMNKGRALITAVNTAAKGL